MGYRDVSLVCWIFVVICAMTTSVSAHATVSQQQSFRTELKTVTEGQVLQAKAAQKASKIRPADGNPPPTYLPQFTTSTARLLPGDSEQAGNVAQCFNQQTGAQIDDEATYTITQTSGLKAVIYPVTVQTFSEIATLTITVPASIKPGVYEVDLAANGPICGAYSTTRYEVTVAPSDTDLGDACPESCSGSDPVNPADGNETLSQTDVPTQGIGFPPSFTRYYNSLDISDQGLGHGWRFTYSRYLS